MSDVHSTEYSFSPKQALLGAQMLFVAFGALVLVPILTGIDSNVALFTAGVGTLIFQLITKGKVPVFLASSFAFLPPLFAAQQGEFTYPEIMCGLVAAGGLYILISVLIRLFGSDFLHRILPPVVTGPVIMLIGLILAPVAVNMALGHNGAIWLVPKTSAMIVAGVALLTTIIVSLLGKGWFKLVPILCGIGAGYACSLIMDATGISASIYQSFVDSAVDGKVAGMGLAPWMGGSLISFGALKDAPGLRHPQLHLPHLELGGHPVRGAHRHRPCHRALRRHPGHRLHFRQGLRQGSRHPEHHARRRHRHFLRLHARRPPNTTYSEVSGAVALTRAFNPAIMTWAAFTAILLAFVGKLGGLLNTIPMPVMGGIMLLLFGAITVIGLSTLVRSQLDLMQPRNMVIIAIIMVFGLGGMVLNIGVTDLKGIGLGAIAGVVLNLVLPGRAEADKKI